MKRVAQLACLLVICAVAAVAAHADSTTTTSTNTDPRVILNDPACPEGAYCVNLTYTGDGSATYTEDDPLEFLAPTPLPNGLDYTCGSTTDENISCATIITQPPPVSFLGVYFWGMSLSPGQVVTLGALGGPVSFDLPENFSCTDGGCSDGIIELTPEPSTAILFAIGLAFLLAGTKRRFGLFDRA